MLGAIRTVRDRLRLDGHYFVLTGRSRLLHLIGTNQTIADGFTSPDITVCVALPPLTEQGVLAMIKEFKMSYIEGEINAIQALTSGIPRAVYLVLRWFLAHPRARGLSENISTVIDVLN